MKTLLFWEPLEGAGGSLKSVGEHQALGNGLLGFFPFFRNLCEGLPSGMLILNFLGASLGFGFSTVNYSNSTRFSSLLIAFSFSSSDSICYWKGSSCIPLTGDQLTLVAFSSVILMLRLPLNRFMSNYMSIFIIAMITHNYESLTSIILFLIWNGKHMLPGYSNGQRVDGF